MGLLLVVFVHPASWQDRDGACDVLQRLSELLTRLRLIWADGGYAGQLVRVAWQFWRYMVDIVTRLSAAVGFVVLSRCRVVERTFAWLGRNRRLSKDYERVPSSSETVVSIAFMRLMLRRLALP
jgi:putative transposase